MNELELLRKLYAQMRANVETRSRSPKWLVDTLNRIAKERGDVSMDVYCFNYNVKCENVNISQIKKIEDNDDFDG